MRFILPAVKIMEYALLEGVHQVYFLRLTINKQLIDVTQNTFFQ